MRVYWINLRWSLCDNSIDLLSITHSVTVAGDRQVEIINYDRYDRVITGLIRRTRWEAVAVNINWSIDGTVWGKNREEHWSVIGSIDQSLQFLFRKVLINVTLIYWISSSSFWWSSETLSKNNLHNCVMSPRNLHSNRVKRLVAQNLTVILWHRFVFIACSGQWFELAAPESIWMTIQENSPIEFDSVIVKWKLDGQGNQSKNEWSS